MTIFQNEGCSKMLNAFSLLTVNVPNKSWMIGSIDSDQVQHVASDLGQHCFPRCVCSNILSYYGISLTKAEAVAMGTNKVDFVAKLAKLKTKFNVCNLLYWYLALYACDLPSSVHPNSINIQSRISFSWLLALQFLSHLL